MCGGLAPCPPPGVSVVMAADVPFERLLAAAGVIAMLPAVLVALVANKHIRGMLPGSHDPSPPISQRS